MFKKTKKTFKNPFKYAITKHCHFPKIEQRYIKYFYMKVGTNELDFDEKHCCKW